MIQKKMGIFGPSYRRDFILKICFGFLLIVFVCAVAFYVYFDKSFENKYIGVLATLEQLNREMCYGIIFSVMAQALFFTLLIFFVSILWTHKIAGPLYQLRKSFLQIANGNLTVVTHFRNTDQLQNIPVILNSGLQQLRASFVRLNSEISAIRCEIELLAEECSEQDSNETARRLQDCEARILKIVEQIEA
jgi:nitrogen fixation/metabolism regulation signal transduction histidine kinase